MADSNVLRAQEYLNAMFGGHPKWVQLDTDGYRSEERRVGK